MDKELLGMTQTGFNVYSIRGDEHMKAHADVSEEILKEAISKAEYMPPFWIESVDLGRVVGKDHCVTVTEEDDVCMVKREGRNIESRVVFNRTAFDTSILTLGICTDDDGLDTVFTAFFGKKVPKEPNDPNLKESERDESEHFWREHALVIE